MKVSDVVGGDEAPQSPLTVADVTGADQKGAQPLTVADVAALPKDAIPTGTPEVQENQNIKIPSPDQYEAEQASDHQKLKQQAFDLAIGKGTLEDYPELHEFMKTKPEDFKDADKENPYLMALHEGVSQIGQGVARTPAFLYSVGTIPYNLYQDATGKSDQQAKVPDWLQNNLLAQHFDVAAKAYAGFEKDYTDKGENFTSLMAKKKYPEAFDYAARSAIAMTPFMIGQTALYMNGMGEAANVAGAVNIGAQKLGENQKAKVSPLAQTSDALVNATAMYLTAHFLQAPTFAWTKNLFAGAGKRGGQLILQKAFTAAMGGAAEMGAGFAQGVAIQASSDIADKVYGIQDQLTLKQIMQRAIESGAVMGAMNGMFHTAGAAASAMAQSHVNTMKGAEPVFTRDQLVAVAQEIELKSKGVKHPSNDGTYSVMPQTLSPEEINAQAIAKDMLQNGEYKEAGAENLKKLATGMKTEMFQRAVEDGMHLIIPQPEEFAMAVAQIPPKYQPFLTPYSAEDYSAMKRFMTPDGKTGFAIKPDGELVSLFDNSDVPNQGKAALVQAIKAGAVYLNCFDSMNHFLPQLYTDFGFEGFRADKFDINLAPAGWDFQKFGTPDIISMTYQGGNRETISERIGQFGAYEHPGYAKSGETGAGQSGEGVRPEVQKPIQTGENPDREITAPIPLDRLTTPDKSSVEEIYGKFGNLIGRDTNQALKVYDLHTAVEDPSILERVQKDFGFTAKTFAYHEDPAAGVQFRVPDIRNDGYKNGTVWIYDPRVADHSFKDVEYTRAWRIFHEIGHAVTEPLIDAKFGQGKREGRLGLPDLAQRGRPGKEIEVPIRALTLHEAQRAIEWEDAAFRAQRLIQERYGISADDSQFAQEYNTNMSDAVYRVLTNHFGNPGDYGFLPSEKPVDLKSVLEFLQNTEGEIAAAQGRTPTPGIDLSTYSPLSDAEIASAVASHTKTGRLAEATRTQPEEENKPEPKTEPAPSAKYQTFEDARQALTTKILSRLPNKSELKPETIQQELNRPDVREAEKNIIKDVLKGFDTSKPIPAKEFLDSVRQELLPLNIVETDKYADYDQRDLKEDYGVAMTYLLEAPFATGVSKHGWDQSTKGYFSHFRATMDADAANDTLKFVVKEVQSDLFQDEHNYKNAIYQELTDTGRKPLESDLGKSTSDIGSEEESKSSLSAFKNTWYERTIKEAIRHAAKTAIDNNLSKVIFRLPTGETALRIEGLAGEENPYSIRTNAPEGQHQFRPMTQDDLAPGVEFDYGGQDHKIVAVHGDGSFEFTPATNVENNFTYDQYVQDAAEDSRNIINDELQSFEKEHKVDLENLTDKQRAKVQDFFDSNKNYMDWRAEKVLRDMVFEKKSKDDAIEGAVAAHLNDLDVQGELESIYSKGTIFVDSRNQNNPEYTVVGKAGLVESGSVPEGDAFITGNELMGNPKEVLSDTAYGVYQLYKKSIDKFLSRYRPGTQLVSDTNGHDWYEVPVNVAKDSTSPVEAFEAEGQGERITPDQAIAKVREYFSEDELSTEVVKKIFTPEGEKALAKYDPIQKMISFAEDPKASTPEHEVVHVWMDMFADEDLRRGALDEASEKFGTVSDKAAEEKLAELFPKWAKDRDAMNATIGGKIKTYFSDLWNSLKNLVGKGDKIQELFKEIYNREPGVSGVSEFSRGNQESFQKEDITRADIMRFLGKDPGEKITKNEEALLRFKLRQEARGAKFGYRAGRADERASAAEKAAQNEVKNAYKDANRVVKERAQELKENMQGLKSQLTFEQRAAKFGYKAGQQEARERILSQLREKQADTASIRQEIVNYAKDNLPVTFRGKFLDMVSDADSQLDMVKAFSRIDKEVEGVNKKAVTSYVKDLVGKIADSKNIAVDYKGKMRELMEGFDLKNRRETTLDRLKSTQAFIDGEKAKGVNVTMPEAVLDSLKILKQKPLADCSQAELENMADRLEMLHKLGETKLSARRAIYDAEKQRLLKDLVDGTKGRISKTPEIPREIGEAAPISDKVKNQFIKALNFAQLTDLTISPMDVVFDHMDGDAGYTGANFRIFKKTTDTNFGDYLLESSKLKDEINAKAEALGLDEPNYERIGVYAADQQEGGREKLANLGITPEQISKIQLTPKEMELYQLMRQRLDETRPQIADIMRDVYNEDMGKVENYFSFMTDWNAMSESDVAKRIGAFSEEYGAPQKNTERGFTKSRVGTGDQKIKLNAMDIYQKHIDNALYLIHVGRDNKMLYEIAANPAYGEAVGDRGQALTLQWLDLIAKKGGKDFDKRIFSLDTLRKNVGAAMIGFKLGTALVHSTLLFQGAGMIGNYEWSGLRNVASSREWREFLMNHFPEVKEKIGNDPAYLEFTDNRPLDKIQRAGMWGIEKIIGITGSATAAGAYEKYCAEHNIPLDFSKPNQDAIQYAQLMMRRAQASSYFKDAPLVLSKGILSEKTQNVSLARALFQFQNFMLDRWSLYRHDLARIGIQNGDFKKAASIAFYMTLANIAEHGIREMSSHMIAGITGTQAKEDDDFTHTAIKQILSNVPFVSQAMSMMEYGSMPVPSLNVLTKMADGMKKVGAGRNAREVGSGYVKLAGVLGNVAGIPGTNQAEQIAQSYIYRDSLQTHNFTEEAKALKQQFKDMQAGKRPYDATIAQRYQQSREISGEINHYNRIKKLLSESDRQSARLRVQDVINKFKK